MKREEIVNQLDTKWVGKNLVFYEKTGSTNLDAKQLAEEGVENGTLVVANMQSSGRGRRGRTWISPAGESVYMSLLLRPVCKPEQASVLTLVMALAVLEAVEECKPDCCGIKWPNDIVISGKKICGILTEMSLEKNAIRYVVIGVGINVNQNSFSEEISDTATSIFQQLGERTDRAQLIGRVMHHFEQLYTKFEETFDLTGMIDSYSRYLVNKGRQVRVLDPKGEYEGVALGVNKQGELLVKRQDGELVEVYAGEVSVRGIYGYI